MEKLGVLEGCTIVRAEKMAASPVAMVSIRLLPHLGATVRLALKAPVESGASLMKYLVQQKAFCPFRT